MKARKTSIGKIGKMKKKAEQFDTKYVENLPEIKFYEKAGKGRKRKDKNIEKRDGKMKNKW